MSKTKIPPAVVAQLWGRSAGRCQFRGCNKEIWRDGMTWQTINQAHIAHIVGDSADGPRGDPQRSSELADKIGNLMLMCQPCHKRIDDKNTWMNYPEALLQEYKRDHESRVSLVTGLDDSRRTHWIVLSARIGGRVPPIDLAEVSAAIVKAGLFPVKPEPYIIDCTASTVLDHEADFWPHHVSNIERRIQRFLDDDIQNSTCKRVCLFGIAPMPLLMKFGHGFGQMVETRVFQRCRDSGAWSWGGGDGSLSFSSSQKLHSQQTETVALSISISGQIDVSAMEAVLGDSFHHYEIRSAELSPAVLRAHGDLQRFGERFLTTISQIVEQHPGIKEISLFPAMPVAAAVEVGRQKLPKGHPSLRVYDYRQGVFSPTIVV